MNKREKLIAVILCLVFGFWLVTVLPELKGTPATKTKPTGIQPDIDGKNTLEDDFESQDYKFIVEQAIRPQQKMFNLIEDPFEEFEARDLIDKTILDFSELNLSGIVFENELPVALINDQILQEGEIVAGFKIIKIRQDEVLLKRGMEKYTLRLFQENLLDTQ